MTWEQQLVEDIKAEIDKGLTEETMGIITYGVCQTLLDKHSQDKKPYKPALRASKLGEVNLCSRKLWYDINEPGDEPLPTKSKMNFMYGDIIEEIILPIVEQANHDVAFKQYEVDVDGVKGHIDCLIDGRLVDVKSTTYLSRFTDQRLYEKDDFGYLSQMSSYLYGLRNDSSLKDKTNGYFLVFDKSNGEIICEKYDLSVHVELKDREVAFAKQIVDSENVPDIPIQFLDPLKHVGNVEMATKCGYCPHMKKCWPNHRAFEYNGRHGTYLKRFIKVEKHPKRKIAGKFVNAPEAKI